MIFQARSIDVHVFAGAQREEFPQEPQAFMHRPHLGVGSEIARTVLHDSAGEQDPRILFRQCNLDVRIGFIILQADIVPRAVFFDEIALQDKRFNFRPSQDRFKIRHFGHHRPHLRGLIAAALKILPYAIFQHHCLAHINDFALGVFHEVDPRRRRQKLEFFRHDVRHGFLLAFRPSCSRGFKYFPV